MNGSNANTSSVWWPAQATVSNTLSLAGLICQAYGHDRWPGSGRCKRCQWHRDAARASG